MDENEAQRLRDRIQRDQTSCRCGHLLAACADCRDWLIQHSPRIARDWWWRIARGQWGGTTWAADAAEADDLEYYLAWRWWAQ